MVDAVGAERQMVTPCRPLYTPCRVSAAGSGGVYIIYLYLFVRVTAFWTRGRCRSPSWSFALAAAAYMLAVEQAAFMGEAMLQATAPALLDHALHPNTRTVEQPNLIGSQSRECLGSCSGSGASRPP